MTEKKTTKTSKGKAVKQVSPSKITGKDKSKTLTKKPPELSLESGQWAIKKGRPKEFDPDYAIELMEEEIEQYLSGKMSTYEELKVGSDEKSKILVKPIAFPTLTDIALRCGVSRQRLSDESNARNNDGSIKNKQLFDTYNAYKEMTLSMMLKGGLVGDYEPRLVQFLANVNYDMVPKTQVEQTVEIKSMDKVFAELDKIHADEAQRLFEQRNEMEKRKAELDRFNDE